MKVKMTVDVETIDCPDIYEDSKEVANGVAQAILIGLGKDFNSSQSWWVKSVKILTVDGSKIGLKFKSVKR